MYVETAQAAKSAHVIVLGNEKGGSGKSTTGAHVAVALLKAGHKVATIDLDSRQQSLSRIFENRRAWAQRTGLALELPRHFVIARGEGESVTSNEAAEFTGFAAAVSEVEATHDFLVIDTPGTDSYLMRLAHSMADTLITPMNDSFVDFDVLARVDAASYSVVGESHYARMVRECRRQRRLVDGRDMDWVVVRNRLSPIASRNQRALEQSVEALGRRLAFRVARGIAERTIYREFFPRGLTALDTLEEKVLGIAPTMSHITARAEVRSLIDALRLPSDEKHRQRQAARAEWFAQADQPLDGMDIFVDEPLMIGALAPISGDVPSLHAR